MKRTILMTALAAFALSGAAYAGNGKGHGNGNGNGHEKHGEWSQHDDHHGDRHDDRRGGRWVRDGRHDNGLHRGWSKGQRIPTVYLVPNYYVRDYQVYRLTPPPRGMVWVRPYPDARQFYLVQMATGIISQVLGGG